VRYDTIAAVPSRHYGVIYVDPPWNFKTYSAKGTGRSAVSHYDTMTFDELIALPVKDWAADDCVLLLWVPGPHTLQGLRLMEAWRFQFKGTGFAWVKLRKMAKAIRSAVAMARARTSNCAGRAHADPRND
jgi:N6-adenosine-specific RNA methylase IME4